MEYLEFRELRVILFDWYDESKSLVLPHLEGVDKSAVLVVYSLLLVVTLSLVSLVRRSKCRRRCGCCSRKQEGKAGKSMNYEEVFEPYSKKKTFKILDVGMTAERIHERVQEWTKQDQSIYNTGKVSGIVYIGEEQKEYHQKATEYVSNSPTCNVF